MKTRRQGAILELIDARRSAARSVAPPLASRLRGDAGDHLPGHQGARPGEARRRRRLSAAGAEALNPETALTALERAAAEFLRQSRSVQQLVVIRTSPGQAQPLALAIDRARLAERSAPSPATTPSGHRRDDRRAAAFVKRLRITPPNGL